MGKLLKGVFVWLMWTASAHAVSLGEMHVYSSPGEPLHADIELLGLGDVALDEVFPAFASEADLGVAGLNHSRYLNSVVISVAVMEDGRPAVKLRSDRPLFDTFLSFLLEIKWSGGRQLREYTALLKLTDEQRRIMDEYRQAMRQGGSTQISKVESEPAVKKVELPAEQSESAVVNVDSADQAGAVGSGIVVGPRETLWDIAQRHRVAERFSTQQFMLALFEKNPHAFRNSDINGLMSGSRLVLPGEQEVGGVSQGDALIELRRRLASSRLANRSPGETLVIESGQTLWDLAARTRAAYGVDARAMMKAIVAANPHAFEEGDPDRMLKGVELKMPPLSALREQGLAVAAGRSEAAESQTEAPQAVQSALPVVEPKVIVIGREDTLWSIAADSMPEGESVLGAMIKAIIAKNPHAFADGDMNTMRVGAELTLPEWHEVQRYIGNKPLNLR